jgi:hypothetical protein
MVVRTLRRVVLVLSLVLSLCLSFYGGYRAGLPVPVTIEDTALQLASQTTILCPSYLSYADQTRLTQGTGLAGVDFIYVERATGIDALTLMAIAAHESAWGSNHWAKEHNNVMSWGISDTNPDQVVFETRSLNVFIAAAGLKRLYLEATGLYWGGAPTLYGINKYYATDKGWASAVLSIVAELEGRLREEQRMKRWCVKTSLFTFDVVWDYEHLVTGFALYKIHLRG